MNFNEMCAIYKSIIFKDTYPIMRIMPLKSKNDLNNFTRTYAYCDTDYLNWDIQAEFLEYLFMNGLVR